jgi:myo-inositol 2-dehydrogenase / D-chiro-inositol 1-dehydrogenase
MSMSEKRGSRRDFMLSAAAGAGAMALGAGKAGAAEKDTLRVGLIGCGRRGTGAIRNCIASSENVVLAAMGDLFPEHLKSAREDLGRLGAACQVTEETAFTGFGAYQQVLDCDVDMVILACPPAFRPKHLAAAVDAGKHVFMEKPAAVDPAGIRSIIATSEKADGKGLSIVAGTQRRHDPVYRDIIAKVHDGIIGDLVAAQCYWIGDYGYYPAVLRKEGWPDVEWQIRNWNYFTWLSGDHIVEQHVHNLDIMNWAFNAHPIKAAAMGGRQQRTGPEFGHIYDHFAVEYIYPGGIRVQSMCRQNADTFRRVGENLVGTKGNANPAAWVRGEKKYRFEGEKANPYVQEHADLIAAIRSGKRINEARQVAESTMTAIIGRMSAYTGQEVDWDWAMNESQLDLVPDPVVFGDKAVAAVAVPGKTPLI